MAHIRDGVKRHQREKEERERTEAAIAGLQRMQQQQRRLPTTPMSPMSTVSQAMQSTTLGGQRSTQSTARNAPQATTTDTNPFTSQSSGQGTLFCPPPPPVTQADRDALKISLAAYPMQPNTPAGNAVWQNQLREWKVKYGENTEVTAITGFPLRPGGAAPGSGECYGCGLVGHRRNSPQCVSGQINPRERTFRTICGRILRFTATPQINFVNDVDDEFNWLNDQSLKHTPSQGNGEGPPA